MMWDALRVSGASSRDRTGDLILTMDALYLLSYRGVFKCEQKYNTNLLCRQHHRPAQVKTRLTARAARHAPIATTRRLLFFHARIRAAASPAIAL